MAASSERSTYLRSIVTGLAQGIGPRPLRESRRLMEASERVEGWFVESGFSISSQAFTSVGRPSRNIVAELTGTRSPQSILVVGAHYDTVAETPGADDNASGVAGLLALARALAEHPLEKTVRFVAFAPEEPPAYRTRAMGSHHYAQSLSRSGADVEGMICLEMIGYFTDRPGSQGYPFPLMRLKYPKTGNFIAMVGNRRSAEFTRRMAEGFRGATDLPLSTLNAPAIVVGIDFSDHWSFGKFGYPALMVTDTSFYRNPHYHAPSDLPDTLDYDRMAEVVQGLAGAVTSWGGGAGPSGSGAPGTGP